MRKKLRDYEDVRSTFEGEFVRFGIKNGWVGEERTVLLREIKNNKGMVVSDHCWFNLTKGFEKLSLVPGDVVRFDARVKTYERGYKGYRDDVYKPIEIDYKLSHPTKLKKVDRIVKNETAS